MIAIKNPAKNPAAKNPANGATVLSEADQLAAKEKTYRKQYPRITKGSARKEVDGHHAGKITVEITCAVRGCKVVRRVATSDLFQVRYCPDCTRKVRNAARRTARGEGNGEAKPAKKAVTKQAKPVKAAKPVTKQAGPNADGKVRVRKAPGTLQSGPVNAGADGPVPFSFNAKNDGPAFPAEQPAVATAEPAPSRS